EAIDPDLPVTGISRHDVDAYIQWRRERDNLPWRLPSGNEWQVAVQGGDGRRFPWGNLHDAAMCYSYTAAPTTSGLVELPVGSFPGDRSLHGVFDLAGSVAELVDESWFDHEGVSVARGGSFTDREGHRFSFAARRAVDNRLPLNSVGFRLAMDAD
ncbi:MAG: serine/threonine protein kinase, partial [Planctomycetota bacterium]